MPFIRPSQQTIYERAKVLLSEEESQPEHWMYCSFALNEPVGKGFLGGIFLRARGIVHAQMWLNSHGLNPGGEMMAVSLPDDDLDKLPAPEFRYRLLNRAELEQACGEIISLKDVEKHNRQFRDGQVICSMGVDKAKTKSQDL